jgi:hypothetical protein
VLLDAHSPESILFSKETYLYFQKRPIYDKKDLACIWTRKLQSQVYFQPIYVYGYICMCVLGALITCICILFVCQHTHTHTHTHIHTHTHTCTHICAWNENKLLKKNSLAQPNNFFLLFFFYPQKKSFIQNKSGAAQPRLWVRLDKIVIIKQSGSRSAFMHMLGPRKGS